VRGQPTRKQRHYVCACVGRALFATTPAALNRSLLATHLGYSFLSSRTKIRTHPFIKLNHGTNIRSRVRGSVTNNNGFWIGFIDNFALQSRLFTINYSATADLPTSQIARTHYPFPGNGFIIGTITSNHYKVFLSFLVQSPCNV
jgi:hypothetical protein